MIVYHALTAVARELGWWFGGAWRVFRGAPKRLLALFIVSMVLWIRGEWEAVAGIVAALLAVAVWARFWPASFDRLVLRRLRQRRFARDLRARWPGLMDAVGLSRLDRMRNLRFHPALCKPQWDQFGRLTVGVGLLQGQTVADVEEAHDRLRTALGARGLRIETDPHRTTCWLRWSFGDPLAEIVPFDGPNPIAETVSAESVPVGITEDGEPFRLDLRVSTLTVGATGAGKASVMWNVILDQAPNIRSGLVEFHGADLKGSMELAMGSKLFTRLARTSPEAVVMLEEAASACVARAQRMAGVVRKLEPSVREPLVIVLIDELAALIAYETDRDLLKRADGALRRLLAMGRAVGFYVFAFVQDPRKETVGMRHLFPQMVGLRLNEADEVTMVLGEGAKRRGAECHRISRSTQGVGYAIAEDGSIIRFRAGYVTDAHIRLVEQLFPAPRQIPIIVPEPEPRTRTRARTEPGDEAQVPRVRRRAS